nr:subtilisin-like protease SBT5.3 [Tanacetum cinerariifolium]
MVKSHLNSLQHDFLAENEGVLSVFESRMNRLHTTHSWKFLGIDSIPQYTNLPMDIKSDVIVGVVDTGVWPESDSFNDYGLGPVPTKFKGECVPGQNFTRSMCNRKIIGSRYYYEAYEAINGPLESFNLTFFRSARDTEGHGTHTSSTVAGSKVSNISLYGLGTGNATGGVPSARLSIYKVCWFGDCEDADILAAFDDAIYDGVDIISMSLGPIPPQPVYFEDAMSIGTFHAFEKGIVVCGSGGNSFFPRTTTNVAPWILTVAASTIDPSGILSRNASFCMRNALDSNLMKGKIVVCKLKSLIADRNKIAIAIKEGGAVGMILMDPLAKDVLSQFVIPSVLIRDAEAQELQSYMSIEKNATARIIPTVANLGTKPAPAMAIFSSKGPNIITPDIIKPDITAPGVNILAAWSPIATEGTAGNSLNYNILSGTSMSCPHIAAVAALLKSVHSDWSPAAVKSAIMTTGLTLTLREETYRFTGLLPTLVKVQLFIMRNLNQLEELKLRFILMS